jgi:hypothetical protein
MGSLFSNALTGKTAVKKNLQGMQRSGCMEGLANHANYMQGK